MSVRSAKRVRYLDVCTAMEILKIEESGMIKVSKSGPEERWGKIEQHFHFKCAKGGLDENVRDMNQLLAIVRSEHNIGQDEKRSLIMSIENDD